MSRIIVSGDYAPFMLWWNKHRIVCTLVSIISFVACAYTNEAALWLLWGVWNGINFFMPGKGYIHEIEETNQIMTNQEE